MKKAKFALVGVSGFGHVHYADIMRAVSDGRADIVCATVINPSEEVERCQKLRASGCVLFDNTDAMFREFAGRVDICFLPVGIGLHAPLSIAAMRAGMNVLVEKPLTATLQEADEIISEVRKTGKFVAVGYQHMYQPPVLEAKRAIVEGRIGRLRAIRGIGLWPRDSAYYSRNNWAGRLRTEKGWILDSPINNALAHYLNLVCFLGGTSIGEMARVSTLEAGLYRANPSIESLDTAFLKMKSAHDVDLLFVTSHASESTLNPIIEAIGEKGSIRLTNSDCTLTTADGTRETTPMPDSEGMREHIMEALLARLQDPEAWIFTPEQARVVTRIVNAAHTSAQMVDVPEDTVEIVAVENKNETRCVWKDLDPVIRNCFDEIRLPTKEDFAFCRNGTAIDPADLRRFDGFKR